MSDVTDQFFVPAKNSHVESKIKGSRFVGRVYSVDTESEIEDVLASPRKSEYDASHHCFAWLLGGYISNETVRFRYFDDGEPSGSAGKPIYDQLCGASVTDALVVVTRWFGGTKLGVGGLVRAYSESAQAALESAGRERRFVYRRFKFTVSFPIYQLLMKLAAESAVTLEDTEFTDTVSGIARVRHSQTSRFESAFTNLTSGQGKLTEVQKD